MIQSDTFTEEKFIEALKQNNKFLITGNTG
jgi:hypothetical protein